MDLKAMLWNLLNQSNSHIIKGDFQFENNLPLQYIHQLWGYLDIEHRDRELHNYTGLKPHFYIEL